MKVAIVRGRRRQRTGPVGGGCFAVASPKGENGKYQNDA